MQLYPHQDTLKNDIFRIWDSGLDNVLGVLPTGGGKTVIVSHIIKERFANVASCAVAHRQELVTQISVALNREGIKHRIIGPDKVIKQAVKEHMLDTGESHYSPNASCAVAGVDTLLRRTTQLAAWMATVKLWVIDESHHVVEDNKWGDAVKLFPNALGLGMTATPCRADGKGLGAHADGVFHEMAEGPTMRWLIDNGFLTDYRIFAPTTDIDMSGVNLGKDGDFNKAKLAKAVQKSKIVGDVVKEYLRICPGKKGVCFSTDVETAHRIAAEFNASGVPAAAVSAKTPAAERASLLAKLKSGEILMLVNVDLFGEGFDLPSIETVIMARPTMSYSLFAQQFGRALRKMLGKTIAYIIDHVGNILMRHGLPDKPRDWTLDARPKRGRAKEDDVDEIPMKACPECSAAYEAILPACPACNHAPKPSVRSGPEHVDGDLAELDAETLAKMRGDVERVDMSVEEFRADLFARNVPHVGHRQQIRKHLETQQKQEGLRGCIAWWAGVLRDQGKTDSVIHKTFYFKFGLDLLSAQALKSAEADKLAKRVVKDMVDSMAH